MSQPIDVGTVLGGRYKVTSSVLTSAEGDVVLQGIDQVLNRTVSIAVAAAENAEQMTTSAREIATGERYSSVQVLDLGVSDGATYLITNLAEPTDLLDLMVATEGPYVEPFYTDTLGSEIFGESRSREPQTYEDDPEYYAELQDNDRPSPLGERLPEINLSDRIAGLRSRLTKARGAAAAGMAGAAAASGAAARRRSGRPEGDEEPGTAEQDAQQQAQRQEDAAADPRSGEHGQADQGAPNSAALYGSDPYATGQYGGDDAASPYGADEFDTGEFDAGEQPTQAQSVGAVPVEEPERTEDQDVRTTEHATAEPTPTAAGPAVSDKVTVYEDDDQDEADPRFGAAAAGAGAAAAGAAASSPQPPAPTSSQPRVGSPSDDSPQSTPAGHGAAASRHAAAGVGAGAAAGAGAERAPSRFPVAARNFQDDDTAAAAAAGGAGAGAGYADDEEDESEGGPRWTRLIVGALLGLVLIAAVIFAFNTLGGDEEPTAGGESTSAEESPSASESGSTAPSPSPTEQAVEPVATGVERVVPGAQELNAQTDDTLPNLIDGNEASLYRSLSFTQPDFGGFASNMILVVELEEASKISQIELSGLNGSGGTYEIAVGESDDFGSAQSITQGSFTGPSVTVPVGSEGEAVEGQYVFFNVTELPRLANPYNESRPYGLQLAEFKVS
ncbi:hypothetical protein GCM10022377_20270 [Zhihengliuella alba]|uniref:ABC transporter substrate-binding protein n=1 Tax=Zhihengliuella alba TaxID=547018 RepID=A0ABP7DJG4_9MICC